MKAGKLDRTIVVQEKTTVKDDYNQRTNTWATHLTVKADFVQNLGGEGVTDDNRTTSRSIQFKTRYHPTITVKMRILFENSWYKIEDIKEIRRQKGLLIKCSLLTQT